MALRSAVTPRNDAFAGGTLSRNGQPPDVGGSFGGAGASGFPGPGVPAIVSARNNSGSNVRIPYARVVPLHAKDALPVKDLALIGTGQKTAFEYDGLESGELAWVLGKQFAIQGIMYPQNVDYSTLATQMPRGPPNQAGRGRPPGGPLAGADGAPLVPHLQPNGYGPDRMQRLAYTNWVESHFLLRAGRQTIDLKAYDMFSATARAIDSELDFWATHGASGSDLFAGIDLAFAMQSPAAPLKPLQLTSAMPQGLFVMERGPFLRSIGVDHRPITIEAQNGDAAGNYLGDFIKKQTVNRHIGSDLAQKALETCLKEAGVFNWVPDGICLSKYETGPNGQGDAEFDARASQLFNVAVQGPAITKTWTHDAKLQCMPMDKVFMLVVGDIGYKISDDETTTTADAATKTAGIRDALRDTVANGSVRLRPQTAATDAIAAPMAPMAAAGVDVGGEAEFTAWIGQTGAAWTAAEIAAGAAAGGSRHGILGYEESMREDNAANAAALKTEAETLWAAYRATFGLGPGAVNSPNDLLQGFDGHAAALRRGARGVSDCKLSNLRLMRATSSFLAQYSHYRTGINADVRDPRESRLGLPMDYNPASQEGGGSYVLGGWCIGTVLDSAASRSVMGNNTVRTAPASMALNISVNVEWWNADKLYQHYQDTERYVKVPSNIAATLIAAGGAIPVNSTEAEIEDLATPAQARLPTPAGTVATRDIRRAGRSPKYSLDLDVEAYNEPAGARAAGNGFRRGWALP